MYYVVTATLRYRNFEEVRECVPDGVSAHIAHSTAMHERGEILMAGVFLDGHEPLQAMAICTSREAAERYRDGDPFTRMGMVAEWLIREWADMFGRSGPDTSV